MEFAPCHAVMMAGMMPKAARWELNIRLIIAAQSLIDHGRCIDRVAGYQGRLRGEQLWDPELAVSSGGQ